MTIWEILGSFGTFFRLEKPGNPAPHVGVSGNGRDHWHVWLMGNFVVADNLRFCCYAITGQICLQVTR
jgi:hypothetical protein